MGQQQSKDELLYQQVNYGNIEGIKALRREGAGLEWVDREGKTPLIAACMNPELFNIAKILIELGANVNAYRPGSHAGTPLHHAAKRGLEPIVRLLLSHGANALVMNDDCQSPLDVARAKGFGKIVRTIESHICLFSGWLKEISGPGFLEALAPQWVSRKVWVVVLPAGPPNPMKPLKLQLVIYSSLQDAQPRTVIALWKAKIDEPKFQHPDPTLIIHDQSKTRHKLASANEGDVQQLRWLYDACRGIAKVVRPPLANNMHSQVNPATAPLSNEDVELAMAINASIQSAMERPPPLHLHSEASNSNGWEISENNVSHNGGGSGGPAPPKASSCGWLDDPSKDAYNGWGAQEAGPSSNPTQHVQSQHVTPPVVQTTSEIPVPASSVASAPPIPEVVDDGPILYPAIDTSPIDLSTPSVESQPSGLSHGVGKDDKGASSSCVVCWDAPVEGACIPCGHMVGCMSCLNEIKGKKGDCPVCRAKIDQILRLYHV